MKVAIIGSGAREHSLCLAIKKSRKIKEIYCIPGNAGTFKIAKNIELDFNNFKELKNFLVINKVELVIVGPEKPLVNGIVDYLENFGIKVFGPNKFCSKLEGSKIFTKKLCKKFEIPTANFQVFNKKKTAIKFLKTCKFPIVVKSDGLASGKGVYICDNIIQSIKAVEEIFNGKFGKARKILIEEFLQGEEMSFFILSDGKSFTKFGNAQDHKRVWEGDKGPNTGGMGAYSPSRLSNIILEKKIINKIIKPTLNALRNKNQKFIGFLFAGLIIVNNEPYLIEYNVRMGDPECQTILPKLKSDFLNLINSCIKGKLKSERIKWETFKSLSIVLCSKGYPEKFINNIHINNLDKIKLKNNEYIFHAGTKLNNLKIISNGGRVLNIVVKSSSFKLCRDRALEIIKKINWKNGYFRKDIGLKVIR
ncbi:phosphoribosylamine--glycine ligase [Candidatus Pelagibacter bacterium]|jgi:phosphoribosylamine--glycine ligase|nr:phosphoribosylamine--glycine ligase [Candidatus Pelagibacter bacterium]